LIRRGRYNRFQSTSLVRGTTSGVAETKIYQSISIHVPRTRDDPFSVFYTVCKRYFNPRPSYEGRQNNLFLILTATAFQSTSLVRGTTSLRHTFATRCYISIHVPRTRDDLFIFCVVLSKVNFNPRPSYEGRPEYKRKNRVGNHFNPRPSYEGRLTGKKLEPYTIEFQSTSLVRGTTVTNSLVSFQTVISIHVPRTRDDNIGVKKLLPYAYFNPRPSYEGRRSILSLTRSTQHFNPRPSYEGRQRACYT